MNYIIRHHVYDHVCAEKKNLHIKNWWMVN